MACLFGHNWDGCKCSKCGTIHSQHYPGGDKKIVLIEKQQKK